MEKMSKPEYTYERIALSAEDIWRLLSHKRNEYFGGVLYFPQIEMYYITTVKKKYKRNKK